VTGSDRFPIGSAIKQRGKMGKAAALPYQILVGRRCRAAQTSTAHLFQGGIEIE
jgi:hypothetical protein